MVLRFGKSFIALMLAAALALATPLSAFAAIQGSDYVGSATVTERNLTITEAPTVECTYGVLVDSDGTVLWERDADTQTAMASTTKIMTAIVALDQGNLEDEYAVSAYAASVGESSAGLKAGMKVSLYDLLCCLLVHSGNDSGIAIAEGLAGSESEFTELMNQKAQELGLTNTHFSNPHGLDAEGHYTSARDLSVMATYAMHNETFRKIVKKKKVKVNLGGTTKTLKTTNSLLKTWDMCNGIKTGYTNNAGYCLAASATDGEKELYAIVLGCSDEAERFTDSCRLLEWGFAHYRKFELANVDDVLAEVPMSGSVSKTIKAGVAEDVSAYALDYDGDISVDIKSVDLPDGADEGEAIGTITWRQDDIVVASATLVAKEHVGSPLPPVAIWTALCRLLGVLTGDDCVAEGVVYAQPIEVQREKDITAGQELDEDLEEEITQDALSAS